MKYAIRELRGKTGLTQKKFAETYGIPLSTLQKWEQAVMTPPDYVINLLARIIPGVDKNLTKIESKKTGHIYYYDKKKKTIKDSIGNEIAVEESIDGVKMSNLGLYADDLFEMLYEIQKRFNDDCRFDKTEDFIFS